MHGQADFVQELLGGQQQVDGQGSVTLDEDGVFRVADKALDAQVLLDFAEEYLDAPAFLVDVGDGMCGQAEVISQEFVMLARFRVTIADAAQAQGFAPADHFDDVVGGDPGPAIYRPPFDQLVNGVVLRRVTKKMLFSPTSRNQE